MQDTRRYQFTLQNQFLLLKAGVGLGEWWRETGHPWEQRHSWGREALGKTQALAQVINHFIVGDVLGQGAQVATKGCATKMLSPPTT